MISEKMKKFKVNTNHLVFFEKGTILECDDNVCYKRHQQQTSANIPKEIVENNPTWFEEVNDEDEKC